MELNTGQVQTTLIPEDRPAEEKFGRVLDSAWSPDGDFCFLAVSQTVGTFDTGGSNRFEIVDVSSGSPEFLPPVILGRDQNSFSPFGPAGVAAAATRAYVADRGSAVVHVIDTDPTSPTRFSYLNSVPAGGGVSGVDVTPDGTRVYGVNRGPSNVVCIDTASNQVGGSACQGIGSIPVSPGPSGSSARIAVSPDGLLACAVFNLGEDCVSCIDTNPASPTFNQEISVIPTSGQRLEDVFFSPDSQNLFVLSALTDELLVVSLEEGQLQRIPVGDFPHGVVATTNPALVVLVSNLNSREISTVGSAQGPFLQPGPIDQDGRTADGYLDSKSQATDCTPEPRDGGVDLGTDARLVITREGCLIQAYQANRPDQVWEICLSDPHPVTGQYQGGVVTIPDSLAAATSPENQLWKRLARFLGKVFQVSLPMRHSFRIDGYDSRFRPTSFVLESEMGDSADPMIVTSRGAWRDTDGDGLTEEIALDAPAFLPNLVLNVSLEDLDQDGVDDYVQIPYGTALRAFLPLGDTNGDGVPDAPALDLDHDGRPDPDLPLSPLASGSPGAQVELKLHFAQFGNGADNGVNLFSQIMLFNLDSEEAANSRVLLRDNSGGPLTIELGGEMVAGEKTEVIPPGGLSILRTSGQGALTVGSVTVISDRAVAGVILFGGSVGLAGVGSSHVMSRGFVAAMESDQGAAINTGIAVQNLEEQPVSPQLLLTDTEGVQLASSRMDLAGKGHNSLFVNEIDWETTDGAELDFSDFLGVLRVESSSQLAATVIQTRPGEFATLPVAPNLVDLTFGQFSSSASSALEQTLHFAQFGDGTSGGAEFFSQILLFNLSQKNASTRVVLRDGGGSSLSVDLNGEVVEGATDLVIPARGLRVLQTDGQGELQVGSVTVSSDQPLAGTILFGGSSGVAGVGSSSLLLKGFEAPMEANTQESINTGIAVMGVEDAALNLDLSLCDQSGSQLATAQIALAALGHRALFLNEVQWEPEVDLSNFKGLLKVGVSGKAAATVVQTRPGVFATQPVVPTLN